ncbi:MAG: Sapep family Mn(2+)-dependent dipeptidase [Firmicutes bacterium]|nr:Sapep family Mn(2+)-dependent dipeptidase [Bacillota bacterium]
MSKNQKDIILNDLKELIAIKSVLSDPQDAAPFGPGCKSALDWFLDKANSYGLATGQSEGYCGWAEYGEGTECVAALCHLDIVPAGEDWATNPFKLTIRDSKLLGRGVTDDKGSAVMCLHALKDIKERGLPLKRRIRVIVGLNEENGSKCMLHYVEHCEIPAASFVPDADFPLINSEKGILHLKARVPLDKFFKDNIASIGGGESFNVIPDRASISIFADSPFGQKLKAICGNKIAECVFTNSEIVGAILAGGHRIEDYTIRDGGELITIEARGKSGHAMAPHKADNAVWKLFSFLNGPAGDSPLVENLCAYFCTVKSAEKLGIYKSDEESGDTTISMGVIEVDDKTLSFSLDIRLNITNNHEDVKKKILAALPARSKLEDVRFSPNLFVSKNSRLITTLLGVYKDVTGLDVYCHRSGGGTYARTIPNAVAFGPTFPGVVTNIHKPNECMPLEDFFAAAEVYKEAFIRLANG